MDAATPAVTSTGMDTPDDASKQPQTPSETPGQETPKPARVVPKVFASPKKKGRNAAGDHKHGQQSLRSKLRKALAPYLTASYLQGEMARRFTKGWCELNPPPDNKDDLPAYVQLHLRELNRVTERWSDCVGNVLDPLAHDMAVDRRLQRLRDREEGKLVESSSLELPGKKQQQVEEEEDVDAGIDYGEGLSSSQIFSAVHLVSDVKVWQQILAAQQAEERRQHAIAELHMNHAAKIIQRSWMAFNTRKKEEQARLDALVSPDVQAMLSAAAYKAMRDARNKLAIMKLRKSFSRKARGFGSAMPRDLEPIPRPDPLPRTSPSHKNLVVGPPRTAGERRGADQTMHNGDEVNESGCTRDSVSRSRSPGRASSDERGASPVRPGSNAASLTKVKSFAARSRKVIEQLVSIKEPSGKQKGGSGRQRSRGPDGLEEGDESDGADDEEDEETTEEEQTDEPDDEETGAADGFSMEDGEGADEEEDEETTEEEDDGLDSDPVSGDEAEAAAAKAAAAAMAEAEEVVQVAAELARAFLGEAAGDSDGEDGGEGGKETGEEGGMAAAASAELIDDEMLRALSAVEAATEAAGGGGAPPSKAASSAISLLAPTPLQAAAAARRGGKDVKGPSGRPSPPAEPAVAPRIRGIHLTGDSALIRQLIAGALAAAAAPVLGRKKALAVAQLGLGDLLMGPSDLGLGGGGGAGATAQPGKGVSPRAAAAKLRPAPSAVAAGRKALEEAMAMGRSRATSNHVQVTLPLEIRAAAAVAAGMPLSVQPPVSPGARRRGSQVGSHIPGGDLTSSNGGVTPKKAWHVPRNSMSGDACVSTDGPGSEGLSHRPRVSYGSGGGVSLPSVAGAYGSGGGGIGGSASGNAREPQSGEGRGGDGVEAPGPGPTSQHGYGIPDYGGSGGMGGAGSLPSPRGSPTTVSAAAAAAAATQPWASPRRGPHHHHHYVPPGAHTITGSLPNPRDGAAAAAGNASGGGSGHAVPPLPREPNWLLPPIGINRSVTGPAGLGGPGGASASASTPPTGGVSPSPATYGSAFPAPSGIIRTASDPNLHPSPSLVTITQYGTDGQPYRPSNLQNGGLPAPVQRGAVGGPINALAAAAGRTRRATVVGSSVDALLQQHLAHLAAVGALPGAQGTLDAGGSPGMQCGFVINGIHGGPAANAARTVRLSVDTSSGQPQPLPSALSGGGGGAGGGTAAARQVAAYLNAVAPRAGP